MSGDAPEWLVSRELLAHLNLATFEALQLMREGRMPALESTPKLYPNGCPILPEGPQRDDL